MIKVEKHSITGSNNRPILIDITLDEKQQKAPLIIFIHGFKGFKDWGAHHLIARYFAHNGYRFLKFNLSHNGVNPNKPNDVTDLESFASNTVSKEMLDTDLVINYALNNLEADRVILVGHSRGGGLAILQTANNPQVKALITWSAIADFSSLWKKEQEEEWRSTGKIYVENARTKEKMPLNISLLEDFETNKKTLDILEHAKKIDVPWLIIQGTDDVNVPLTTAQQLANANSKSKLVKIEGANHVFGASHPYEKDTLPAQLLQVCEKCSLFLTGLNIK
jgi:pimeloyl-ACP methyl ester carboxylesterase